MHYYTPLPSRRFLHISGAERATFLQGLITNDIRKVEAGTPIFSAMLTPQGKFFADFFIIPAPDAPSNAFLLETDESFLPALKQKLTLYKLRAKVTIEDASEQYQSHAFWGDSTSPEVPENAACFADPRLSALGYRIISPNNASLEKAPDSLASMEEYHAHRISLGVPDGVEDATERSLILDLGYEELGAIDYQKGCYVGQEVTARMHYKEVQRKGIIQVTATNEGASLPEKGTPILASRDEKQVEIGELTSTSGSCGLAMVKYAALDEYNHFSTNGMTITLTHPKWRNVIAA